MKVVEIAKICHEANKAYCQTIGDDSQVSWEDAPEWQKESAIKGVIYHLFNKMSTPADSHNSWMEEKKREGWKWGMVKNPELKEHPCYVPFESLPQDQQTKDHLFLGIVRSLESFIEDKYFWRDWG
jgi:hypothetical protein